VAIVRQLTLETFENIDRFTIRIPGNGGGYTKAVQNLLKVRGESKNQFGVLRAI